MPEPELLLAELVNSTGLPAEATAIAGPISAPVRPTPP